ncbi:MAG: transcriptional regulator YeiL [Erysipelotrichaceae bacterium]|nr:transcriptional regulator YeiL [Erysipelotrichaceae bacterium]
MKEIKNKELIEKLINKSDFKSQFSYDISSCIRAYEYKSNEWIIRQDDPNEYLYFLVRGRVKLYLLLEDGKHSLLNYLSAPCFIGEVELFTNSTNTGGVKAFTDCVCFKIALKDIKEVLEKDVLFYKNLGKYLTEKYIASQRTYLKSINYPLKNRLAAFILLAERDGYYKEKHTEVAEFLGVSYRHLLYTIDELIRDKILERQGRYLKILDRERINGLAKY